MSVRGRTVELLVLGGCGFILTQAILSLVLTPGDTPTDGNPIWKLILGVSYLGVAALLAPYYLETLYVLRRNWFLVGLVLLALASCFWAAMPTLVLRRSVAVFGTTLLGVALAVRFSAEDQLRLMSWLFRTIAVLSLGCILLFPSYGISKNGEWQGIFSYKNGLGSVMALSVLVEWQIRAHGRLARFAKGLAILVSGGLLVCSGSITPMIALLGALIFTELYKLAALRLRIPLYVIALVTVLVIASGMMAIVSDTERVTNVVGRSSDLTGRTEIWSLVSSYILERPILGYGYSGFWSGASPESEAVDRTMGTTIMYSHNGYLEMLLTLGVVGFILTLGFLASGIRRAIYCSERNRTSVNLWPLAFLSFFLLHNLGECTILFQDLEWALCVATVLSSDGALLAFDPEEGEECLLAPSKEFT